MLSYKRSCRFKVFIRLFLRIEPTRVLGNLLAFPKGESDAWHETRQALAEHEGAGWARWNRGGIKRVNYGFAMDSEKKKKTREKKKLENKESGGQDISQQIPRVCADMGPRRIYCTPGTPV